MKNWKYLLTLNLSRLFYWLVNSLSAPQTCPIRISRNEAMRQLLEKFETPKGEEQEC